MNLTWAATGAGFGLLAGAALRGTVFRLSVASGDPERTACGRCGAATFRMLAVRCGNCGSSLGPPLTLELATAVVLALLLGHFGDQPEVVAFGFLGVLGVALAAIDLTVQRLPDPLTLPAYPILIILLAAAAVASHDAARPGLAGLAHADCRRGARFCALSIGQPGVAGRAARHVAQRDFLRPLPPRRCPTRHARQRPLAGPPATLRP